MNRVTFKKEGDYNHRVCVDLKPTCIFVRKGVDVRGWSCVADLDNGGRTVLFTLRNRNRTKAVTRILITVGIVSILKKDCDEMQAKLDAKALEI